MQYSSSEVSGKHPCIFRIPSSAKGFPGHGKTKLSPGQVSGLSLDLVPSCVRGESNLYWATWAYFLPIAGQYDKDKPQIFLE